MKHIVMLAMAALLTLPFAATPARARGPESVDAIIAQKAMPAVVNISTWKTKRSDDPSEPPRRIKTYGSGFIIDPSGIIVTNRHVIEGALAIFVTFSDGNRLPGRLIAFAPMVDLAVVKVNANHPLPVLAWGDSTALRVGDPVLTIGNPLAIGMSVAAGIVSALNRDIQDTPFDSYIQTDAALNHGNSGGPLVGSDGTVVGVDTALYNPNDVGGFIGIGLAIPAETAKFVVSHLLDPNQPKPGWLGITLQDLTPELAAALVQRGATGAIVTALDAGGPADKAGLQEGDILSSINGTKLGDARAFMRAIAQIPPGKQAELTFWRDGKAQPATATTAQWPNSSPSVGTASPAAAAAMKQEMPDPGVKLAELTDATRKQYGIGPKVSGVVVVSVERDCEARDLGVVAGDVVVAVQGVKVTTPEQVRQGVETAHEQGRPFAAVLINGRNGLRWVSISLGGSDVP
jgi:serine protease Do